MTCPNKFVAAEVVREDAVAWVNADVLLAGLARSRALGRPELARHAVPPPARRMARLIAKVELAALYAVVGPLEFRHLCFTSDLARLMQLAPSRLAPLVLTHDSAPHVRDGCERLMVCRKRSARLRQIYALCDDGCSSSLC